eukprot:m.243081 g.243081  ORF g.243081 m.243081 type:complete len:79 (-) comp15834_c1_seq1:833-1069(-)
MANPVCFMDITVNGQPVGRLEIVVREDIVPKTTASFVNLCRDGEDTTPSIEIPQSDTMLTRCNQGTKGLACTESSQGL